MEVEYHN